MFLNYPAQIMFKSTKMEMLFYSIAMGIPFLIPPMILTREIFKACEAHLQVTTVRKAVTLLLSYIIFTKPIMEKHATGLLLIAMGIILKMLPNPMPNTTRKQNNNEAFRNQPSKVVASSKEDLEESGALKSDT